MVEGTSNNKESIKNEKKSKRKKSSFPRSKMLESYIIYFSPWHVKWDIKLHNIFLSISLDHMVGNFIHIYFEMILEEPKTDRNINSLKMNLYLIRIFDDIGLKLSKFFKLDII